eukprot:scaffold52553_cov74-Phaeocystis_antarctica.AAC.2
MRPPPRAPPQWLPLSQLLLRRPENGGPGANGRPCHLKGHHLLTVLVLLDDQLLGPTSRQHRRHHVAPPTRRGHQDDEEGVDAGCNAQVHPERVEVAAQRGAGGRLPFVGRMHDRDMWSHQDGVKAEAGGWAQP